MQPVKFSDRVNLKALCHGGLILDCGVVMSVDQATKVYATHHHFNLQITEQSPPPVFTNLIGI